MQANLQRLGQELAALSLAIELTEPQARLQNLQQTLTRHLLTFRFVLL